MSEAVFMGARVGQCRVLPDLVKLTVIVDWKQPPTALNLASFIGLTGHFWDLIKGYAKIEGPLQNLLTTVALPQPCMKTMYQWAMSTHRLEEWWTEEHTQVFLDLKIAIMLCTPIIFPIIVSSFCLVSSSSFQEGCPLHCYAIYGTKDSLCYEWTLLCYWYGTMALLVISDSSGILG
jgi:hypothetical protein